MSSAEAGEQVFSRSTLQPLYRLLGHQGSVLALLVVKERGWLVSSSSAGDVRVSGPSPCALLALWLTLNRYGVLVTCSRCTSYTHVMILRVISIRWHGTNATVEPCTLVR